MKELLRIAIHQDTIEAMELAQFRKALLLSEREETRSKGRRKLIAFLTNGSKALRPLVLAGLILNDYWCGDWPSVIVRCEELAEEFPCSPISLWASSLLVSVYKSMGMKRESFEAESSKMRLVKKILTHSQDSADRIYALSELKRELENRDYTEAMNLEDELHQLLHQEGLTLPVDFSSNEDLN